MRKLVLVLLLLVPCVVPVRAQSPAITTTVCPGAGCVDMNVGGQGHIGIQVTGTFVGTLTFYGSINNADFVAFAVTPAAGGSTVTTATATGLWTAQIAGLSTFRVGFSAFTSGSATVSRRVTVN